MVRRGVRFTYTMCISAMSTATYTNARLHTQMHNYMHKCTATCTNARLHTQMHTDSLVFLQKIPYDIHAHTNALMRAHTHTHTYTRTHTHLWQPSRVHRLRRNSCASSTSGKRSPRWRCETRPTHIHTCAHNSICPDIHKNAIKKRASGKRSPGWRCKTQPTHAHTRTHTYIHTNTHTQIHT